MSTLDHSPNESDGLVLQVKSFSLRVCCSTWLSCPTRPVCLSGLRAHEPAECSVPAEFLIRVTVYERKNRFQISRTIIEISSTWFSGALTSSSLVFILASGTDSHMIFSTRHEKACWCP